MALERALSRIVALRQPYCLLIERLESRALPAVLAPYYREAWIVERRVLHRDGEEYRIQWILRDGAGVSRLVAVFNAGGEDSGDAGEAPLDGGESGATVPSGFIEIYGVSGLIELERQLFDTGEETLVEYQYRQIPSGTRPFLIRADTRRTSTDGEGNGYQEDLYTDYYRYTRNYSLRAIERIFHQAASEAGGRSSGELAIGSNGGAITADGSDAEAADSGPPRTALRFPRRSLDSKDEESFVSPSVAYGSQFLEELQAEAPERVVYDTDARGRILGETRWGEDGELIAELQNEWSDNRLSRVVYTSGEDEMVTEYEYNADGDRITERNYRNGVLERVVHFSGDREDEELYMNGELILRAQWEGGRKIREERVRSSRNGGRTSP
ncbi:MAG: hypothetical protein LBU00_00740 [Treponema sp.]|jgi:hypothetical protein|nr:hypothetical protein [Treponema sp.]